jgi:5'-nucleotidase
MRILITNDDGIHARGLAVLEEIARALSEDVWVVAPETDQSGVSHSLSLNDPLRLREIGPRHFAVKGTPTDCVIIGTRHVIPDAKPDLVLSGVNRGRNAAEDVTYSGTVAGAIEGTVLGIPSFALSQAYAGATKLDPHWDTALKFAPDLIRRVLADGMPRDVFVNINFPDCPPEGVKGIAVTSQGKRDQELLRARQSVLLDRLRAQPPSVRAQWHRPLGARRQPDRRHAAAPRHDRRAVHDAARGDSRIARDFALDQWIGVA